MKMVNFAAILVTLWGNFAATNHVFLYTSSKCLLLCCQNPIDRVLICTFLLFPSTFFANKDITRRTNNSKEKVGEVFSQGRRKPISQGEWLFCGPASKIILPLFEVVIKLPRRAGKLTNQFGNLGNSGFSSGRQTKKIPFTLCSSLFSWKRNSFFLHSEAEHVTA